MVLTGRGVGSSSAYPGGGTEEFMRLFSVHTAEDAKITIK